MLRPELVDLAVMSYTQNTRTIGCRWEASYLTASFYNVSDFSLIAIDFLLDSSVDRLPIKLILICTLKPVTYRASLKPGVYRVQIILLRLSDLLSLGPIALLT